ncbi:integrase arm-type DNA-binding domain-containing protein [Novosphingobium sp. PY1]|uniref:tyrosine-type recombinase/integrase n=1 Tax=Novosphingobium sp. PY1 TaxID=1882221 RepID=UPI001A8E9055|nr:integrase arm-type DNA-binding domain-containing protein [Novosphingobium sp. PY1]
MGYWGYRLLLTDAACRKAIPSEKDRKMFDDRGLYLFVRRSGSKLWRLKYRFAGKEKSLSIGPYPEVSISQARQARDRALQQLRDGIDPSAEKQSRKAQAVADALDSFEKVARAWHAAKATTLAPRYSAAVLSRLENNVFPALGQKPIRSITPPMVLAVIRKIEKRGAHDMAHRVRNHMSDVFVWAIASGLSENDPAAIIRKALVPTDPKLRPAMIKIAGARKLLADIEALAGTHWSTLLASRLLALTAARPGVVRLAEKQEFEGLDGAAPIWRIPAEKMKLTRAQKRDITWEFVIPLSRQAAEVAKAAISESLACHTSDGPSWLFPGTGAWKRPISDSTLSKLYRDAGFTGVHVPHGWRSTFSTIMNERAALEDQERDRAIIDLMLAHAQQGVEPIYNRALYLPRRRELAQDWADLLMKDAVAPQFLLPEYRPWRAKSGETGHERRARIRRPLAQKL